MPQRTTTIQHPTRLQMLSTKEFNCTQHVTGHLTGCLIAAAAAAATAGRAIRCAATLSSNQVGATPLGCFIILSENPRITYGTVAQTWQIARGPDTVARCRAEALYGMEAARSYYGRPCHSLQYKRSTNAPHYCCQTATQRRYCNNQIGSSYCTSSTHTLPTTHRQLPTWPEGCVRQRC